MKPHEQAISNMIDLRIIELWSLLKLRFDLVGEKNFTDDDAELWSAVTLHRAVQERLNEQTSSDTD